ncbi:hypothetical protein FB567DRAFT_548445 [Paraphoma chrysanthemicola]|uniref:Uncharacterized protein n=1 Tax=Paraphoma chrysanthemicola TaxID=798071 RepID=A0A8K0RAB6_9PLEO|nr:hypothetical protein FB567DRAFT_548445 [Paraphoma chrysanthemicola]
MPGVYKQEQNKRIAAAKAQGQRVYVSGIQGHQSLETGVAYHYRGHYVYAYPNGNPIEPVPFQTKKGINIIGTVQDNVPLYAPNDPSLVPEASLAALKKSCQHVWDAQKEEEEQRKMETSQIIDEEAVDDEEGGVALEMPTTYHQGSYYAPNMLDEVMRSTMTPLIPQQVSSRAPSRAVSYTSLPHLSFTPHDRAQYLADSAPGTRLPSISNTPHHSRPVSPSRGATSLRQTASTSRLSALVAEDRMPRAFTALSNVAEGNTHLFTSYSDMGLDSETNSLAEEWASPRETAVFVETVSRPPSPRNLPVGTGRPRRASLALNHAWNARLDGDQSAQGSKAVVSARLPKCTLHGEECDGVGTTETWKTQHAARTTGFKEAVPVLVGAGDRVMVDWFALLREEQAKMG